MRDQTTSEPRVRMGAMTSAFPPTKAPAKPVEDGSKVKMGAMTPTFPPACRR
jgi:hypothetical protein